MSIDDSTREVLAAAVIDGSALRLVGQLDRAEYARVNKVLEALGGKWNRKAGAHVFSGDPSEALAAILGGARVPGPDRTEEGYVATPADLAADILSVHTRVPFLTTGSTVLEPSAGDGAFVRAIRNANQRVHAFAVEPNEDRARQLAGDSSVTVWVSTFEQFAAQMIRPFDAVVMNPPFAVPGQPTIWIDHVRLAWDLLAPGGRLTAIVPASLGFRKDRRHQEMRALVAELGGSADLPTDAFASQGTGVHTMVLWLDRPERGER